MLCGISTRFQVLSPSYGQVTHALLTRPPLSTSKFNRSLLRKLPARLACVRHAASVRPEPGSNSLVNCYIMHLKRIIYFTSSFQLIFRLTCSSCPTPTGFRRQVSKLLFLTTYFVRFLSQNTSKLFKSLHCLILKVPSSPQGATDTYYITVSIVCQAFFKTFFKLF